MVNKMQISFVYRRARNNGVGGRGFLVVLIKQTKKNY